MMREKLPVRYSQPPVAAGGPVNALFVQPYAAREFVALFDAGYPIA
jgi:hypothetical protein